MVIQVIQKRPSLGAQLGSAVGRGLAESIPKLTDRYLLSQGLKQFEQDYQGLTPMQQLARLAAIPGITPQTIQSFAELARDQSMRNAERPKGGGIKRVSPTQPVSFTGFGSQSSKSGQPEIVQPADENAPYGQPQINQQNPLREEAIPYIPMTPEERDAEISQLRDDNPWMTREQAIAKQQDNERLRAQRPQAVQAQDKYFDEQKEKVTTRFGNLLSKKLEKNPPTKDSNGNLIPSEETYKDITGENIANVERLIERDLRLNPKATVEDVAQKWSTHLLNLAKSKSDLREIKNLSFRDRLKQPGTTYSRLKQISKSFSDTGNAEEMFNLLKADFGMSSGGAALMAYPPTKDLDKVINSINPFKLDSKTPYDNPRQRALRLANSIEDKLTGNDSLLAISRAMLEKDPYFDQESFFDYFTENQDRLRLNKRQRRELEQRGSVRNWGDLYNTFWR